MNEERRNELEAFGRAHIRGWRDSTLNKREYCEAHGLPLKRFGNWRTKFKHEDPRLTGKLLYRRGGVTEHMLRHVGSDEHPYIPSGRSGDGCPRRNFGKADKQRFVEEACSPGASVSDVAKKCGVGPWLLIQWKRDLMPDPEPMFIEVRLDHDATSPGEAAKPLPVASPPIVVERSVPGIEVDLKGGRRVRLYRETDP